MSNSLFVTCNDLDAEFLTRAYEAAEMMINKYGREKCLALITIWTREWTQTLFKPTGETGKYSYFIEKYVKAKIALEMFDKLYNLRSSDKLNALIDICNEEITK